jgi:hypothetical protein
LAFYEQSASTKTPGAIVQRHLVFMGALSGLPNDQRDRLARALTVSTTPR